MLVQSILLTRVVAVYPPQILSRPRVLLIYTPIVAFKIARVVNVVLFSIHVNNAVRKNPLGALDAGPVAWSLPNANIEWFLQVFDDM